MSYEPTPPPFGEPQPTAAMPAGWYPDDQGLQRYWDGSAWTEHTAQPAVAQQYQPQQYTTQGSAVATATSSDENTMAALAHGLAIFAGFLGPPIILLVKGNESNYVKHHAVEALNFSITVFLAVIVSAVLMIVLIGFLLLPVIGIGALILHILAAVAASRGEWYRYPINIRMIPGP